MKKMVQQKCPNCGAATRFDPTTGKLVCDFCDSVFDIEEVPEEPKEEKKESGGTSEGFDFSSLNEQAADPNAEALPIYVCSSCGAEVIATAEQFSLTCPYCGSNIVLTDKASGSLRPDGMIPFKVDAKSLPERMNDFYKGKKLLPKNFFTASTMSKITGVYVPFWVFSGKVGGNMRFSAESSSTSREGDYEVTETDHYLLKRDIDLEFENVPVDASGRIDDALMDSIEPFDASEEKPFDTRYLAGFTADRFDRAKEDIAPRAEERVASTVEDLVSGEAGSGFDSVTPSGQDLVLDLKARYLLYPVYLFNMSHGDKTY
ncbi:MAG: hypothetical protein IKN53_03410, partial [Oscillibacter sp.]|nr:hypothetical protein [Oscillibacter sp.]